MTRTVSALAIFLFHLPVFVQTIDVAAIEQDRILKNASRWMSEPPVTITAFPAVRSAGGRNEFYSEGDYWWPNPARPDSPYVQRDGVSNPDNFVKHRHAMQRFSEAVSTLAAAYLVTDDEKYARQAIAHLKAWFVDTSTKMLPHLEYAQAIKGRVTGRGIGIIDTIHLIEVARATEILSQSRSFSGDDREAVKKWFAEYLAWMTTHQYGTNERDAKNNHGTWWVAQVAAFAHLVRDEQLLAFARERFRSVLIPGQMGEDGNFPRELSRTKPYNYSIFNLEGMSLICQILSTDKERLWDFELPDGRGIRRAVEFLFPSIKDKTAWPYHKDVANFESYPARHSFLLFAGLAYKRPAYLALWESLEPDPKNEEVQRAFPIRQPVLWIGRNP